MLLAMADLWFCSLYTKCSKMGHDSSMAKFAFFIILFVRMCTVTNCSVFKIFLWEKLLLARVHGVVISVQAHVSTIH